MICFMSDISHICPGCAGTLIIAAYIKRLKAERRADMEARKAERMKNPRRARRTPAQHRVRKVS